MVHLHVRGVDPLVLIVRIQLLTVQIRAKLRAEDRAPAKARKRARRIGTLAAGQIGNAPVVQQGFSRLGNAKHIHGKVHIGTSNKQNLF